MPKQIKHKENASPGRSMGVFSGHDFMVQHVTENPRIFHLSIRDLQNVSLQIWKLADKEAGKDQFANDLTNR